MPQLEDTETTPAPVIEKKYDTSLLDFLIDKFLATDNSKMLEVLCGYFFKIFKSLLDKGRKTMLEYLLNTRNGDCFDALRRHLNMHSVSMLLNELFQIQIKPEQEERAGKNMRDMSSWDYSDHEEEDSEKPEGTFTPAQLSQKEILKEKCDQSVLRLLDACSSKNAHDLEMTMNANAILLEFCENNHCFNILTKPECLNRLTQICCEGESNQQNLPYALNLLSVIINEFSNSDKEISDEHKQEIYKLFS